MSTSATITSNPLAWKLAASAQAFATPGWRCRTPSSPNALDAGVPLRDAQILARHADPRTTEHYDRAPGNLDRHGVHFLTAYVAEV